MGYLIIASRPKTINEKRPLLVYDRQTIIVFFVIENFGVKQLGSIAYITGPGRRRRVDEKYNNKPDTCSARISSTLRRYDQTTNHLAAKKATGFHVSI